MRKIIITDAAAAVLILLFLYTAASKLIGHSGFTSSLRQAGFTGRFRPVLVAWIVPLIEVMVSFLLFFSKTRLAGFWTSAIIMAVFTGYIFWMLFTVPHLPCSCGGVIAALSWPQHLVFNLFFLLVSLGGALTQIRIAKSPDEK